MRQVALVASEKREFDGLLRRLGPGSPMESPLAYARRVRSAHCEWLLYADGQGVRAAARACQAIPFSEAVQAVGSIGWAGGARPHWRIGEVLLASRVLDRHSGEVFGCWRPQGTAWPEGSVLTVDRVIRQAAEKRRIGEAGVDVVEMEAAAVARCVAKQQRDGFPGVFFALKAISDTCDEDLAFDFDRARRNDGSIRVGSVLAQALHRPWYRLPQLGKLAKAARLASDNLGMALEALFPQASESGPARQSTVSPETMQAGATEYGNS